MMMAIPPNNGDDDGNSAFRDLIGRKQVVVDWVGLGPRTRTDLISTLDRHRPAAHRRVYSHFKSTLSLSPCERKPLVE